MSPTKLATLVASVAVTAFLLLTSIYTIEEGHVGITTTFSKATGQVGPGINFKRPLIDGVKQIEIRERKNGEELAGATKNQLPVTALVTVNWTVNESAALELFKRYGSLDQFESRILDPKLRQAAKAAISKFNADELIRDRNAATALIQEYLVAAMEPYPVTVTSPQIENVVLPEIYMQSVLAKEQAREDAAKEKYNLERQKLEAQKLTQTAEAQRDAAIAQADGEAYRIREEAKANAESTRLKGEAEADAIRAVEQALSSNPLIVQLEQAKRWNGQLPSTIMGGQSDLPIIYSLKQGGTQ